MTGNYVIIIEFNFQILQDRAFICQETKEWTAIHDRKNALASLANPEMKTLQPRNITQP